MAKAKKITKEELEAVQQPVTNINNLYANVGRTVVGLLRSMGVAVTELDNLESALQEQQRELEEKYGSVTINLSNGEYEEVVEEATEA